MLKVKHLLEDSANKLKFFFIQCGQSQKEIAEIFIREDADIGIVKNKDKEIIGILSKELFFETIIKDNHKTPIIELLVKKVGYVDTNEELTNLINSQMQYIVVQEKGQLMGVLSRNNILEVYSNYCHQINDYLNTIINSAYNAVITINTENEITFYNKAAEKLFGVTVNEALGKQVFSIVENTRLDQITKTGIVEYGKKLFHEGKTILSNRAPITKNGSIIGAVAVLQDISEFEKISNELEYSHKLNQELDSIIESSFDGIYITDGEGNTVRINKAYTRITGIEANEVIGKNMKDLVKKGFYDQSVTLIVMEEKKPVTIMQEVRTGKTILVTGNPIFDEKGKLFRVVTNVRDITELNNLKKEVEQVRGLSDHYKEELNKYKVQGSEQYVIRSPKMKDILDLIIRLGKVDSTVLFQGESGCGKEVLADILHQNSLRSKNVMVKINCGAIPNNLLEAELFGYEPGAFTGAKSRGKPGKFEIADGGILFLDEIGELNIDLQVKLLRALQEMKITRVGGTKPISINVRIITATNQDLEMLTDKGKFRKDLYYRLNVIPIKIPPLRERKEEIIPLATNFLNHFNNKYGFNKRFDANSLNCMVNYSWPGNIRELRNFIERAIVTSNNEIITSTPDKYNYGIVTENHEKTSNNLKQELRRVEKKLISNALLKHGSTRKAAKFLGISQSSVMRKISEYNIKY